jgi:hypothetical protein
MDFRQLTLLVNSTAYLMKMFSMLGPIKLHQGVPRRSEAVGVEGHVITLLLLFWSFPRAYFIQSD